LLVACGSEYKFPLLRRERNCDAYYPLNLGLRRVTLLASRFIMLGLAPETTSADALFLTEFPNYAARIVAGSSHWLKAGVIPS
jgi:hypothetical protein